MSSFPLLVTYLKMVKLRLRKINTYIYPKTTQKHASIKMAGFATSQAKNKKYVHLQES